MESLQDTTNADSDFWNGIRAPLWSFRSSLHGQKSQITKLGLNAGARSSGTSHFSLAVGRTVPSFASSRASETAVDGGEQCGI